VVSGRDQRERDAAGVTTLEEVGAVAGVSRATVSRVINGSPRVSPEAKVAVERAIAKLGYSPNRAARSLVTRRTDTIALVVSEREESFFSEPFFAAVVRGLSSAAAREDKNLVIVLAQDGEERERARRFLRSDHVDGIVLMSLHGDDPLPRQLARVGMPTVLIGRPLGRAPVSYVDADNRGGARAAVEHLLGLGRSTVATISGPSTMCAGIDRLDGYRDALEAAGIRVSSALIEAGDFGQESGYEAMRRLIRRRPRLDAVFAASDTMAAGALQALREAGRQVPEEVAVVGFDDIQLALHTVPPLTTVRQPVDAMTEATAALLRRRIAGEGQSVERVVCPTALVRRRSA
jgi:DNA-binding LacI/PurR family transcriptional regulator